jgi:hypothetical protein
MGCGRGKAERGGQGAARSNALAVGGRWEVGGRDGYQQAAAVSAAGSAVVRGVRACTQTERAEKLRRQDRRVETGWHTTGRVYERVCHHHPQHGENRRALIDTLCSSHHDEGDKRFRRAEMPNLEESKGERGRSPACGVKNLQTPTSRRRYGDTPPAVCSTLTAPLVLLASRADARHVAGGRGRDGRRVQRGTAPPRAATGARPHTHTALAAPPRCESSAGVPLLTLDERHTHHTSAMLRDHRHAPGERNPGRGFPLNSAFL